MRQILYVEDNVVNLTLMQLVIGAMSGVELVHAPDGETGVAMAADLRPAVILMDINLPGIDGLEATRRLKQAEQTRDIPVIAISADTTDANIAKALDAGCVEFVGKPFDVPALLSLIGGLCAPSAPAV